MIGAACCCIQATKMTLEKRKWRIVDVHGKVDSTPFGPISRKEAEDVLSGIKQQHPTAELFPVQDDD